MNDDQLCSLHLTSNLADKMPVPTEGAPKNYEELEVLLKDDTKVKVAGESRAGHPGISGGSTGRALADDTGVDVDGVLRGKIMAKSKFLSAVKGNGFGFCSVLFGWDSTSLNTARQCPELKSSP